MNRDQFQKAGLLPLVEPDQETHEFPYLALSLATPTWATIVRYGKDWAQSCNLIVGKIELTFDANEQYPAVALHVYGNDDRTYLVEGDFLDGEPLLDFRYPDPIRMVVTIQGHFGTKTVRLLTNLLDVKGSV